MPSDKKRKRSAGDAHKPSRRRRPVTFENDSLKLSVVDLKAADQAPALVVPIGLSVPHQPLKAYSKNHGEKINQQEIVLQSSEHPRLDFLGEEDAGSDALLKHYVGVYDPTSGEVKLISARRVALRSTLRPSQEELNLALGKGYQTMTTMRQNLGMEFGTRQAKKMITSLTENAIIAGDSAKPTAASKALLESIAQNVANLPTLQEMAEAAEAAKPKPKANLAATVSKDVYPIETLIDEYILQEIDVDDWIKVTAEGKGINTTSRYVSRRLTSIAQKQDTVKLKVLKYILMVIEYFQCLRKTKNNGMRLKGIDSFKQIKHPPYLMEGIKKRFSKSIDLTAFDIDYLITHVLAMSLYIDDYITDIHELKDDFRLDQPKIINYFNELGCRIGPATEKEKVSFKLTANEAKATKIARLEIPLEFPQDRVAGAGRRK